MLRRTLLASALSLAALPAFAAGTLCPESVDVKQSGAAPAPGWAVTYATTPNRLEMVTFYDGPLKDEASLVYDDLAKGKDSSIATWRFPQNPRGYWVKCSYGGTTLELSKALPATLASCRVTYARDASSSQGMPAIRQIVCQ